MSNTYQDPKDKNEDKEPEDDQFADTELPDVWSKGQMITIFTDDMAAEDPDAEPEE